MGQVCRKARWISETDLKEKVMEIEKGKEYRICGFPQDMGGGIISICENPAGENTPHPGSGRCNRHGGWGKNMVIGNGSNSPGKGKSLYALFQQHMYDEDWSNIKKQLAYMKGIMDKVWEELAQIDVNQENVIAISSDGTRVIKNLEVYEFMLKAAMTISKVVGDMKKYDEKMTYTADDFRVYAKFFVDLVKRRVDDVALKRDMFDSMMKFDFQKEVDQDRTTMKIGGDHEQQN